MLRKHLSEGVGVGGDPNEGRPVTQAREEEAIREAAARALGWGRRELACPTHKGRRPIGWGQVSIMSVWWPGASSRGASQVLGRT